MNPDDASVVEKVRNLENIARFVTEEQVFSADVARKRRNITRKRSNAQKRDKTPLKEIATTTDDEIEAARPKTPERRRRKKTLSGGNQSQNEQQPSDDGKSSSFLARITMRGRAKSKKTDKELVKRSQSAPHPFTQEELIESFRKAQLLDFSDDEEEPPPKPKKTALKPEVENFIKQRRRSKNATASKIVEILDPKTSNVIATKAPMLQEFSLKHLFMVLRTYTIRELCTNYSNYKKDMKAETKRIRLLRNRCLCELVLIIVLCGFGGFLFRFVEGRFEVFYKCGVKRVKRDFIELLWTKSHNLREDDWKSLARNKLRNFEEELHTAHEAGMKTYSGQRAWSFLNSVVYSMTVVTTIGYGHIYPETVPGKALTIVYAIVGMPLFLLALTDFGKLFTRCIKFLWSYVRRLYYTGSCRRARKTAHVEEFFKGAQMMYEIATFRRPSTYVVDAENPTNPDPNNPPAIAEDTPTTPAISNFEIDDEFNLPISLAIFILVLYIFLGATVYCVWEHWNFFDSFYFVFISMSTIGFGDMVPNDPVIMIVSIVYLVFGLALMSMCINVVQEKLSDTFKQASTKIGATMGITVAEEDGSITVIPAESVELPKVHHGNADVNTEEEKNTAEPTEE